jgi:hypothetical protein
MYWVNTMLVIKFWQQQISFTFCEDRYLNLQNGGQLSWQRSLIRLYHYQNKLSKESISYGQQAPKAYMLATT